MEFTFGNLLQLAGGLMGRSEDKKNRAERAENRRMAQHQFDQQMDYSIQRRVKDAQAAGVHPLFAMGASSGGSPTFQVSGGGQPTGSAMGDALSGIGKQLAQAQINKTQMEAEQAFAEAQLARSHAFKLRQDMESRGRDGASVTIGKPGPDVQFGPAEFFNPEVPVSSRHGVRAGVEPERIELMDPSGRKTTVLNPNAGLDEVSQVMWVANYMTQQVKDIGSWLRARGARREVADLERRLAAIKANPEKSRAAQEQAKILRALVRDYYNRYKNFRRRFK